MRFEVSSAILVLMALLICPLQAYEEPITLDPVCGIGDEGYLMTDTLGGIRVRIPSQNYSEEFKATHPIPPGFTYDSYYNREWDVSSDYTLEFRGNYLEGAPVFVFIHHEPHAHAFSGFSLQNDLFIPRYEQYEQLTEDGWYGLPVLGCGTGDRSFLLQPNKAYRIRVHIPYKSLPKERWTLASEEDYESVEDVEVEMVPVSAQKLRIVIRATGGMTFTSSPIDIETLKEHD